MKSVVASILMALVTLLLAGEAAAQTTLRMNPDQRVGTDRQEATLGHSVGREGMRTHDQLY